MIWKRFHDFLSQESSLWNCLHSVITFCLKNLYVCVLVDLRIYPHMFMGMCSHIWKGTANLTKVFWCINHAFYFLCLMMFWYLEGTYRPGERLPPQSYLIPKDSKQLEHTSYLQANYPLYLTLRHQANNSPALNQPRTMYHSARHSPYAPKPIRIIQTSQS